MTVYAVAHIKISSSRRLFLMSLILNKEGDRGIRFIGTWTMSLKFFTTVSIEQIHLVYDDQ